MQPADLILVVLIPLIQGLLGCAKPLMSEAARKRWLRPVALAVGIAAVALWQLAQGVALGSAREAAHLILCGLATGLSAVGLYHAGKFASSFRVTE